MHAPDTDTPANAISALRPPKLVTKECVGAPASHIVMESWEEECAHTNTLTGCKQGRQWDTVEGGVGIFHISFHSNCPTRGNS